MRLGLWHDNLAVRAGLECPAYLLFKHSPAGTFRQNSKNKRDHGAGDRHEEPSAVHSFLAMEALAHITACSRFVSAKLRSLEAGQSLSRSSASSLAVARILMYLSG